MSDKFNARKGLEIGRGLAEDATIEVKNTSANFPYVKYSETEQVWKFSNDGTTESEFGSGGSWGEITGTLSDQTDLQNALDEKLNSADNLTDVADQQTALNNITAVSGATDEYVLTKDTTTGNAQWKLTTDFTKITKVTSADNAVVRFDGVTGEVQYSSVFIDDDGDLTVEGKTICNGIESDGVTIVQNGITYTKLAPTQQAEAVSLEYFNNHLSLPSSDYGVPYSVNSGYTDSDGRGDIINKESNTEISFKVDNGTTYKPLLITYPNNTQETVTSLTNITGISGDGNYIIVKERGNNTPILVKERDDVPVLTADSSIVSCSSYISADFEKWRAFDKRLVDSFWHNNSSTYPLSTNPAWVMIDLGENAPLLKGFSINARPNFPAQIPSTFFVQGSNNKDDDNAWENLYTAENLEASNEIKGKLNCNKIYRYIRLYATKTSGNDGTVSLSCFNLYTSKAVDEYIGFKTSVNGDYSLDTSTKPYTPYYNNNGTIEVRQYVKLGEITILSDTMGTPITYAFNGKVDINVGQVTVGNEYSFPHNLGTDKFVNNSVFTDVKDTTNIIAGSSNFSIGDVQVFYSEATSYINGSSFNYQDNKTCRLRTGGSAIWVGSSGSECFMTANVNLRLERSF